MNIVIISLFTHFVKSIIKHFCISYFSHMLVMNKMNNNNKVFLSYMYDFTKIIYNY